MIRIFPKKDDAGKILSLAYPVMLGMMARTVMGLVDTAMVGRLGSAQLAATGLGFHMVWLIVYSFGMFNIGVQALTSRRYGENNLRQCGEVVQGTVVIVGVAGLAGSLLLYLFGAPLFRFFTSDPAVCEYGSSYVTIRFLEMFAIGMFGLHRGFFDGIGRTKVFMKAMLVMNALNIVLNYLLIFGAFGFPRLEVTGAALGSMLSSYIAAVIYISSAFRKEYREKFGLYTDLRPKPALIGTLLKLGYPSILQHWIIIGGFLTFLKIVGMVGTVELATSNICLSIVNVSFMPGFGISIVTATLVGQNLGAGLKDKAESFVHESMKLGVLFMGSFGILFFLFPGHFIRVFTADQAVIHSGMIVLRILGVIQFLDAIGIVYSGALKGAGMIRYVMIADLICIWGIFVPTTYLLAITLGHGIIGAWFGLSSYIVSFGLVMTVSVRKGNWKNAVV